MLVNCISINTLQRPKTIFSFLKNVLIKTQPTELPEIMYKELGNNIPKFFQYEGGMGLTFIFCVDSNVDIKRICKKYNYDIGDNLHKMEIDEITYNNNYQVYPTNLYKPAYILHP